VAHYWWGYCSRLAPHHQPPIFRRAPRLILLGVGIVLFLGVSRAWNLFGTWGAAASLLVYFFVLPLVVKPIVDRWFHYELPEGVEPDQCGACGARIQYPTHSRENLTTGEIQWLCDECMRRAER
jgi:hypothetical protein